MSLRQVLLKQAKPRIWLGGIRDMITRTQQYYTLLNVGLLLITTYTVREATIRKFLPWFNAWWLLGIIAISAVVIVILDYRFIRPSLIAYQQHEAYKHRNLLRRDLDKDRDENKQRAARLDERMERIEKLLEEIRGKQD